MQNYKLWINGEWKTSSEIHDIRSPYSSEVVSKVPQATAQDLEAALKATDSAFKIFRRSSRCLRSRLLTLIAQGISERRTELAKSIVDEAGKPLSLADAEVGRAIMTFTIASEEAKRFGGEVVPVDIEASGRAYSPAETQWVPSGPVLAITPFNFPLNLVAHKVAPALAVGASVIVKPPHQAPGASLILAQIFEWAAKQASDSQEQVPPATLQVISAHNDLISKAVVDPRIAILSFTGSDKVGWMLKEKASRKKVALELGGNAAVIINSDADLKRAAARCAYGGFAYAGQICISVQRIFVHQDVAVQFQSLFLDEIKKLGVGDPAKKDVSVGPIIDEKSKDRILSWIEEAKADGAKVLTGGTATQNVIAPTVVSSVGSKQKLNTEEVFGPVVTLENFSKFEDAIESVNRSKFGLQAGIFTDSASKQQYAVDHLEVGGIIINEVPTFRADNMPYGGMKESGVGREGVIYTMREYSDIKTVVAWRGNPI